MTTRSIRLRDGSVVRVAATPDPDGHIRIRLDDGAPLTPALPAPMPAVPAPPPPTPRSAHTIVLRAPQPAAVPMRPLFLLLGARADAAAPPGQVPLPVGPQPAAVPIPRPARPAPPPPAADPYLAAFLLGPLDE